MTEEEITLGLIDAVIAICATLEDRRMDSPARMAAFKKMALDPHVNSVIEAGKWVYEQEINAR